MLIGLYMLMLQYGKKIKTAIVERIKYFREIGRLLTAIYCPKEVAVMHCKGHNSNGSKVAEGN